MQAGRQSRGFALSVCSRRKQEGTTRPLFDTNMEGLTSLIPPPLRSPLHQHRRGDLLNAPLPRSPTFPFISTQEGCYHNYERAGVRGTLVFYFIFILPTNFAYNRQCCPLRALFDTTAELPRPSTHQRGSTRDLCLPPPLCHHLCLSPPLPVTTSATTPSIAQIICGGGSAVPFGHFSTQQQSSLVRRHINEDPLVISACHHLCLSPPLPPLPPSRKSCVEGVPLPPSPSPTVPHSNREWRATTSATTTVSNSQVIQHASRGVCCHRTTTSHITTLSASSVAGNASGRALVNFFCI